jgi:hypothetical protein
MCRPSDSPGIRLFSGEEKVCSKQNTFPGCTGKCRCFSWKQAQLPNHRLTGELASSNQAWFFREQAFFQEMTRRIHRQRLSDDQCPRGVRAVFDNVLINVVARGAFEGAQVEVGFCWFDSRKMHRRATFCAGGGREFWIRT